jgi:hypothetical protein
MVTVLYVLAIAAGVLGAAVIVVFLFSRDE